MGFGWSLGREVSRPSIIQRKKGAGLGEQHLGRDRGISTRNSTPCTLIFKKARAEKRDTSRGCFDIPKNAIKRNARKKTSLWATRNFRIRKGREKNGRKKKISERRQGRWAWELQERRR